MPLGKGPVGTSPLMGAQASQSGTTPPRMLARDRSGHQYAPIQDRGPSVVASLSTLTEEDIR